MLKVILLVIGISIVSIVSTAYTAQRSVDVRDFDIAGVKIGMDWNQALGAAAKHFQVAPADFKVGEKATKYNPIIHKITGLDIPSHFSYRRGGINFFVNFIARIPVDKNRPLVVTVINYDITQTGANIAEMKKASLAKYGEPSEPGRVLSGAEIEWCANPKTTQYTPRICADTDNNAVLSLDSTKLTLKDYEWTRKLNTFINREKDIKPSF